MLKMNRISVAVILSLWMRCSLASNISLDDDHNSVCGRTYQTRVIGGEDAAQGEFPWMAGLIHRNTLLWRPTDVRVFCGGALINSQYVLTAAHCFTSKTNEDVMVRLGALHLDGNDDNPIPPMDVGISEVTSHENYNVGAFMNNDIALLRLEHPVAYTQCIIPICLPPRDSGNFVDEYATVSGWGHTNYGGNPSKILQKVRLTVVPIDDCYRAYVPSAVFVNDNTQLCAGFPEGGKDSCQGDSGGPLTLLYEGRWILIGTVSIGNKCALPGYYGIYTRVSGFLDWIYDNMQET